jgi:putative endonuclease
MMRLDERNGEPFCYVYMLANRRDGTLYVGVTSDLIRRVYQHKTGEVEGFTKRYRVDRLVYFEPCEDIQAAIAREKHIKKWNRSWKIELIEKHNPDWSDLYSEIAS